jgi:hypothetical protein
LAAEKRDTQNWRIGFLVENNLIEADLACRWGNTNGVQYG